MYKRLLQSQRSRYPKRAEQLQKRRVTAKGSFQRFFKRHARTRSSRHQTYDHRRLPSRPLSLTHPFQNSVSSQKKQARLSSGIFPFQKVIHPAWPTQRHFTARLLPAFRVNVTTFGINCKFARDSRPAFTLLGFFATSHKRTRYLGISSHSQIAPSSCLERHQWRNRGHQRLPL